jgi:hypothetical protein
MIAGYYEIEHLGAERTARHLEDARQNALVANTGNGGPMTSARAAVAWVGGVLESAGRQLKSVAPTARATGRERKDRQEAVLFAHHASLSQ